MCNSLVRPCRLFLFFLLALTGASAAAQTPQGTAFSYQGELKQNGAPVTASVDMLFDLFDAATAGHAVGPSVPFTSGNGNPVAVQNGIFTVTLDFGALAFNTLVSDERYLRVTVNGNVLSPRTKIENAPYALQSRTAELAYAVSNSSVGAAQISAGSVGATQINTAQVQARVSGSCTAGDKILAVNANGTVTCAPDAVGTGTVSSIESGPGLTGGPIVDSGTLGIADAGVGLAQIDTAQVQARINGVCFLGEYVRGINADGSVVCTPVPGAVQRITSIDTANSVGFDTSIAIGADGLPVVSYADNSASDLKVAHCANAACTGTAAVTPVDSTGIVGFYNSIAIGSDGFPVVSYFDTNNGNLKVAHCINAACTGTSTLTPIDITGNVGLYTSIAIGTDGLPVVSYHDADAGRLKVAHCANVLCTSTSVTPVSVDTNPSVGQYTSIAIGADGLPIVSYWDGANSRLKVAHCADADCSGAAALTAVDSVASVGKYTSIAIGGDGLAIISYFDTTNGDLKVAQCANAECTGSATLTTVDSTGTVGQYTSIRIGSDGLPVISYYDVTNGNLKVAHCADAACSASDTQTAVDSSGDVGRYTSIAIGADGLPVVSYLDFTNGDLKLLKCNNRFCQ